MFIGQGSGTECGQLELEAVALLQAPEVAVELAAVVVALQAVAMAAVAAEAALGQLGLGATCQSQALAATVADQLAASQAEVRALGLELLELAFQEAVALAWRPIHLELGSGRPVALQLWWHAHELRLRARSVSEAQQPGLRG
jgi:hypothetical protein